MIMNCNSQQSRTLVDLWRLRDQITGTCVSLEELVLALKLVQESIQDYQRTEPNHLNLLFNDMDRTVVSMIVLVLHQILKTVKIRLEGHGIISTVYNHIVDNNRKDCRVFGQLVQPSSTPSHYMFSYNISRIEEIDSEDETIIDPFNVNSWSMILDTSQSKPDQYSSHVVERNMSISTTTSLSCDGSDAFDIFDNQSKVDHPPKFREFITHPIRKLEGLYKMKRRITKKNTGKRINYSSTVRELLKDWLYTHQSDPYPTEDEKDHLCGLTKMSKVQLNNWFVNGRRRYLN